MTLMKRARSGVTEEIRVAAESEGMDPEKLRRLVVDGRAVIPINPIHNPRPVPIGEGLNVKINVNLGTSPDHVDYDEEVEKAQVALKYGADALMDLSIGGDIDAMRRRILDLSPVPVGTVPIYQKGREMALEAAIVNLTSDDIFNGIEKHAKDGVDFMTVHCGITMESVGKLKNSGRLNDVVSRGGSFLTAWILHNEKESPLYAEYDYLLEMAVEYDFTLSLGDGLRPGCISDASDRAQIQELIIIGELVERARAANVQAMVEGPGHVPLNQIEANVRMEKTICKGAPFYVLGPLVTDVSPGYDHITAAIGGALAAYHGADFLCYVTPSEHLCLPNVEDVREGTIASKIAAHAADLALGRGWERDNAVARARKALDWDTLIANVLDPEKAAKYRKDRSPEHKEVCSMCGDLCAIKMVNDYLEKG